ncbi:MAG: hypothetical protein K6A33_11585 [Clostridiales bacterium]|nr:hypothetical protein [Clostridiales bacterium]
MEKLPYRNPISVAGHRGNAKYFPENTMASFRSAVALNPDMIELDVHMSKDGRLVVMHDHKVDRTTDGTGFLHDLTLDEIRTLDAGAWKGEEFRGERVPTFEEFLSLMAEHPDIMLNVELKDYPAMWGSFAYESAEKTIAMMDSFGVTGRSVVNTWSGELNEWIAEKYGDRVRIHAYHPQELMGKGQKRFVYDYAYCVCLFSTWKGAEVVPKQMFDFARTYGVEPWVFYPKDTPAAYDESIANGAVLFTSNDPAWAMDYLRQKGLHG